MAKSIKKKHQDIFQIYGVNGSSNIIEAKKKSDSWLWIMFFDCKKFDFTQPEPPMIWESLEPGLKNNWFNALFFYNLKMDFEITKLSNHTGISIHNFDCSKKFT